MNRWWALGAIVLAAGCQNPYPAANPFGPYGTRVVPPPATGTVGVPSGYPAPGYATPPVYQPPPMSNGTVPSLPGSPPGGASMLAPPSGADVGNWESANSPNGPNFGLAPPIIPRNPYATAQLPSTVGPAPLRESQQLSWQPPASTHPPAMYQSNPHAYSTTANFTAPSQIADARPQFGGTLTAFPIADTVYIPPVRPSVVRQAGHEVVTYSSALPGMAGCCDPVDDPGGRLGPVPFRQPATYTSQVDDRWEPRRLR